MLPPTSMPQSGFSYSDIMTTLQNVVKAVNSASIVYQGVQGSQNRAAMTAATLVKGSAGRLAVVVVTTTSTNAGAVYDAPATGITTTPIYTIPATVGVYVVNMPVSLGILVVPGTGQTVTVSYS